ncbi:hypothetical protein L6R50_08025 [Myxococcota bacterium]|nr:hypothetical protein [Myxococcota bacterium]
MSRGTRRILWALILVALTGGAWASARAVNEKVAAWLVVPEGKEGGDKRVAERKARRERKEAASNGAAGAAAQPPATPPEGQAPAGDPPDPQVDAQGDAAPILAGGEPAEDPPTPAVAGVQGYVRPIVARSLFDSSKVGIVAEGTGDEDGDGDAVQVSDLQAELVGTIPARDPSYSTALIRRSGELGVYRIGSQIEDATVDFIDRRRIEVVRGNGDREEIVIGSSTTTATKKPATERPATDGKHTWDGIRELGENRYQIDQSELQYAMGNLDKLSRDARIVPNMDNGKNNGFKVFGIRRDSVFKKLGVKNNDVLTAVNGEPLTTDKVLDLYSKLSSARSLSLDVIRRGEPVTLEYEIR